MSLLRSILIIFVLSFLMCSSCKSQIQEASTKNLGQVYAKKSKKYQPKNLKLLSAYIDTLQINRFYREIKKFEHDDSININKEIDIVFVGSSSIRKWESLEQDMLGLNVLNRGFGGSTVPEAIFYADVLFLKHRPNKIVFYSGDNDVAMLKTSSAQIIDSYKYLYKILRAELPNTQIFILSIKPSPARWQFWPQMQEINTFLKKFCAKNTNCKFIDVSSDLIDSNGNLKSELFKKDRIHLNEKGYALWTDIIFPVISKEKFKTENK